MIIFVRHGQTDYNITEKICGGETDAPLNKTGLKQVDEAGKKLKNQKIDIAICSTMFRAKQTANSILKYHKNVPILYDERLIERIYGEAEGLFTPLLGDYWKMDYKIKFDGMESIPHLFERVKSVYEEILLKFKDQNVLVVAHAGVGRVSRCFFDGFPKSGDLNDYYMDNAEVITLKK